MKRTERNRTDHQMATLWAEALRQGMYRSREVMPTPMVVRQHASPMDDNSPVTREWYVPEGPCGFAWVMIRPARGPMVAYLKSQGIGSTSYMGGYMIWCPLPTQSMEIKLGWAQGVACHLVENGIGAYADSRLD